MLAAGYNKEYLPIEGLDGFRKATVQLLLGADHPAIKENKVAVVQVRRPPHHGPTTLCAALLAAGAQQPTMQTAVPLRGASQAWHGMRKL
jgi:aspartate/tyrosine/aromatic aminotransferase